MAQDNRRRNTLIAVIVVIILLLLLLLSRCMKPAAKPAAPETPAAQPSAITETNPAPPAPATPEVEEVLTAATLTLPERVPAGSAFSVSWTGPDNKGDFVTVVRADAPDNASGHYQETQVGPTLELTAPMEPGAHEVRYITGRSRTILGRTAVVVEPVAASLDATAEVTLGTRFDVRWTGPNNDGDYITIVAVGAPDDQYTSYADAKEGASVTLTAPTTTGDFELRYVAGQGRTVLARRPIRVVAAEVSLEAPAEAIAGSTIDVSWVGPNNAGDYITVVSSDTPDGRYANYSNTSQGSPLKLLTPIMAGDAELRYMTGQGNKVLGRRAIRIAAAVVTLSADKECSVGGTVTVTWTGPNHPGDYITVVKKATPDGQYAAYTNTTKGSPLTVPAPKEAGEAEVRYMTGQGNKVLARIPITIVP
jgi:hypothetical protein